MPSGPKKRKKAAATAAAAAKRNGEEEMGLSHPPKPLPPHQELEEKGEMESSENAKEETPSSEPPVYEVKDVNVEFVHSKEEEPSVSERSPGILLEKADASEAAADVKDEVGGSSWGGETSVSKRPTEILLEKVDKEASAALLTEENLEVSEAAAETFGDSKEEVGVSSLGGETSVTERCTEIVLQKPTEEESVEVSEVPVSVPSDSALSEGEESREMLNMGTVIGFSAPPAPAPAPLLQHRASLWNCCGLLDVFKSSQR